MRRSSSSLWASSTPPTGFQAEEIAQDVIRRAIEHPDDRAEDRRKRAAADATTRSETPSGSLMAMYFGPSSPRVMWRKVMTREPEHDGNGVDDRGQR